ncbi:MAG TPA: hypothetical protein VFW23_14230 [Tepidisphaeraceae bacterium]|nr:hypothetical protein [Tepidisphaeraceae bacterium]
MKRFRIRALTWVLAGIAAILILFLVAGHFLDQDSPISAALEWARLAPFPSSARDIKIEKDGGMFTREFTISFTAAPDDVSRWIKASPGPASASRTSDGSVTIYSIKPGGGASFAEVRVDEKTGRVVIHTYWS